MFLKVSTLIENTCYQITAKLHENKNRFITITRELINYGMLQRVIAQTFQTSLMNIFDMLPDLIFFSVHGCVICLPFHYCFICAWENEKKRQQILRETNISGRK